MIVTPSELQQPFCLECIDVEIQVAATFPLEYQALTWHIAKKDSRGGWGRESERERERERDCQIQTFKANDELGVKEIRSRVMVEKMRNSQQIRRWVSEYISGKTKAHLCIRYMIAVMLCSRVLSIIALIFPRRLCRCVYALFQGEAFRLLLFLLH